MKTRHVSGYIGHFRNFEIIEKVNNELQSKKRMDNKSRT